MATAQEANQLIRDYCNTNNVPSTSNPDISAPLQVFLAASTIVDKTVAFRELKVSATVEKR